MYGMTTDTFISFFSSFLNLMQRTQRYNARSVYNDQRVKSATYICIHLEKRPKRPW